MVYVSLVNPKLECIMVDYLILASIYPKIAL